MALLRSTLLLNLHEPTLLYHGSTSLYFTLHFSTMGLRHCTWFYITQSWLYFILFHSTIFYPGSTSLYLTLHYSTMVVRHSTSLYFILHYSIMARHNSTSLYFLYHCSTSLYLTLHLLPWLYFFFFNQICYTKTDRLQPEVASTIGCTSFKIK